MIQFTCTILLHSSLGRKIISILNSKEITLFKAATRQPSAFKCEGPVRLHDKPFMSAISCSQSVISNYFDSKTKNKENHIENKIPSEMEVAPRYKLF